MPHHQEAVPDQAGLYLTVEFTLKPGMREQFEAVLLPHIARVADESTCLLMAASRDPEDDTRYILFERWADKDEFWDVQMRRGYREAYYEAIAPMQADPTILSRVASYASTFFRSKG